MLCGTWLCDYNPPLSSPIFQTFLDPVCDCGSCSRDSLRVCIPSDSSLSSILLVPDFYQPLSYLGQREGRRSAVKRNFRYSPPPSILKGEGCSFPIEDCPLSHHSCQLWNPIQHFHLETVMKWLLNAIEIIQAPFD